MGCTKVHDTSNELLLFSYKNGIKLMRPNADMMQDQFRVSQLLAIPVNVYFLDTSSAYVNLNEICMENCGFSSIEEALGKTVHHVATKATAAASIAHDQLVMKKRSYHIQAEALQRLQDDVTYQAVAFKFPWYSIDNNIIGILGFSVVLDSRNSIPFNNALSMISQTGLLKPAMPDSDGALFSLSSNAETPENSFVLKDRVIPNLAYASNCHSECKDECIYSS